MNTDGTPAPSSPTPKTFHVQPVGMPPSRERRTFRERILAGLLLALPLLITLWILGWLYSLLERELIDPVVGLLLWKLKWTTSSTELPYWFEKYVAPLLAILLVVGILYVLDLLAESRLSHGVGWTLRRMPVISQIYNPVNQIFQSLEKQPDQQRPQRMVLVTFPHPGVKLPAFVTATCRDVDTQKTLLCVYIPTTPVPTSGFFLLVPEDEATDLNWNTEQTLQAVMSGGLVCPKEVTFFKDRHHADNPAPPPVPGGPPQSPPDSSNPPTGT
jgi:uncharacterized membrane protein